MSRAATRVDDNCSGHGCFPPRPSVGGSPNVFINGKPAIRVGDPYGPHACGGPPHTSVLAAGSSTVFINRKAAGRIADPVACGSVVAEGSSNVFIGG